VLDSETVIRTPHDTTVTRTGGKKRVRVNDPRTSVSIKDRGCELVLFFDDPGRQGPLLEVRLLPATDELAPHVLRQFLPQAPLYTQYARMVMTDNQGDWLATATALRDMGSTRRGLSDDFYRLISRNYASLRAEGEKHPVKALSEMHHVSISAASRWLTEARERGMLDGK
jgi:hypothetical protein